MIIDYLAIFGVGVSITGNNMANLADIQVIVLLVLVCGFLWRFVMGLYSCEWPTMFCIVGLSVWIIYSRYLVAKYGVWICCDLFASIRPYQKLITAVVMLFMMHSRFKAVFGKNYLQDFFSFVNDRFKNR